MHQHPDKVTNSTFSTQSCPKTRFRFGISDNLSQNKNQHPRDTVCANFQAKQTALTFLSQTCQKMETNVGIGISIFEILCVPIFRQNGQIWLFGSNWPKSRFWGRDFEKLRPDAESAPPRYHVC